MDYLDLDESEEPREKWLRLEGIGESMTLQPVENGSKPDTGAAILLRYCSPELGDSFRRFCERDGIAKMSDGIFQVNTGRELAYYKAIARHYVKDWQGFRKGGADLPCTPDNVATVLRRRGDVLRLVSKAIFREESFFASNGNAPT